MKKKIGFLLITTGQLLFAQSNFEIKNGSKRFDAQISVFQCEGDTCSGEGIVKLIDKKTKKLFQTLKSEDLYFS